MAEPSDADREAIFVILAAQEAAWAAGDAAGFSAAALPDVVFTNVIGMFSVGIEPFKAQHARIFSTIYQGSRMTQEVAHITMATDDVAIVDTLTTGTGFRQPPPGAIPIDGAIRTRLEQVMVRRDGAWRVQSFHNVIVHPDAPPPAVAAT